MKRMLTVRELNRIVNDLERATTCTWERHTAEAVLEHVLDDIAEIVTKMRKSLRTEEEYLQGDA